MRRKVAGWAACSLLAVASLAIAWTAARPARVAEGPSPVNPTDGPPAADAAAAEHSQAAVNGPHIRRPLPDEERRYQATKNFTLWLDDVPDAILAARQVTGDASNIHREDYAGPAACRECHKKQYESWSGHPHRWMNALADATTVKGDFSDRQISYLGGEITMTKVGDSYRMRLARGDTRREYVVDQTIGSRFFQYYVGRQLSGPEPAAHPIYKEAHVLPLGYWLDRREWVPTVHVAEDRDYKQQDPYLVRENSTSMREYLHSAVGLYRANCNFCHTTFPLGDMLSRFHEVVGQFVPTRTDLAFSAYVQRSRPELWPAGKYPEEMAPNELFDILLEYRSLDAPTHAVTLGVSCEACHLGARQHAEGKQKKPQFFPQAPELAVLTRKDASGNRPSYDFGRTHDNINWACGRCHTGTRSQFAAGMATWNSTEYSDAMRGSCYSQLTCIHCHDPHETLGAGWSRTPAQDDALCLKCHQQYEPAEALVAHTHHQQASEGSRCMNCHMPRLNEGLQAVVRTHMIFSPTNSAMIEANHPHACGQCHVEQPIDWTLTHLQEWYGQTYSEAAIALKYPERKGPVAVGWLHSDNEAVRLVAADTLCRAGAKWAVPELLKMLDDPFILNRQFTRMGLESMLQVQLKDDGYEFYMTPEERRQPIEKLRRRLVPADNN